MRKLYTRHFTVLASALFFLSACKTGPSPGLIFPEDRAIDTLTFSYDKHKFPMVNVEINGATYHFIFDSGSHTTLLDKEITVKKVINDDFFTDVFGDDYQAPRVALDTLRLGKMIFSGLNRYKQRDIKYDGILGGNILRRLVWKIDFVNRKIYVAKNSRNFGVNPVRGIPFKLRGSRPIFTCRINGVEMELMIDTGFSGFTSINSGALDTLPELRKKAIFWRGISEVNTNNPFLAANYVAKTDSTWHLKATFQTGDRALDNEIIRFSSLPANLAGMDFLRRFDHVILDYPGRMLYLGKEQPKSYILLSEIAANMNTMGVQLSMDSLPRVTRIASFEQTKDLRVNDTIIAINGVSFADREPAFYKRGGFERRGEMANIPGFKTSPSFHNIVIENFNKSLPVSEIKVKRGDSTWTIRLIRKYQVPDPPETVWSYVGMPTDFPYITQGYSITLTPSGAKGKFKSRKPPADALEKDYDPKGRTEIIYYF